MLITPALRLLKESYPDCRITVLVQDYTRPLFETNPDVDEIMLVTHKRKMLYQLRSAHFDTSLHFFDEPEYAGLARKAGIKHRIGYGSKPLVKWMYTHQVKQHCQDLNKHVIEQHCGLLEPMGIQVKDIPPMRLVPDKGLTLPVDIDPNGFTVAIHPTTGKGNKAWLPERYAQVVDHLMQEKKANVIITGSEKEKPVAGKLLQLCRSKPVDLTGKTSLKQMILLLSKVKLYVGGDTGPMHMSAALGIPVAAIFPSKLVKPTFWGPWKTRNVIVRRSEQCSLKCLPSKCLFDTCAKVISARDVTGAINTLLEGGTSDWLKASMNILTNSEDVFRELHINGYSAYRIKMVNNLPDMIKSIIKDDINVIHWVGSSKPLFLRIASQLSSPSLSVPPLLVFDKSPKRRGFKELVELYSGGMKKR